MKLLFVLALVSTASACLLHERRPRTRAPNGYMTLYEGNGASQDIVCQLQWFGNEVWNFKDREGGCQNDEARSVILTQAKRGDQITFYDSPTGRTDDDYVVIKVKQDLHNYLLSTFEQNLNDDKIDMTYYRHNGLDGKVSRVTVVENQEEERSGESFNGYMTLYEGNGATQDVVCSLPWFGNQVWNFKDRQGGCKNDEARSAILYKAKKGDKITFYDSPTGRTDDDYVVITVKQDLEDTYVLDTFEQSLSNDQIDMTYYRHNGLDGKVSRVTVEENQEEESRSGSSNGYMTLYEGNGATQDVVCNLQWSGNQVWNFKDRQTACQNDKARSVSIHKAKRGDKITFYSSSAGRTDDDYVVIRVKQDLYTNFNLDTFERSFSNAIIEVIYHHYNGLDGKVSRVTVEENQEEEGSFGSYNGYMTLYEGHEATQDIVCALHWSGNQAWNFEYRQGGCKNNEARSVIIHKAKRGDRITFYGSSTGRTDDDYVVITVKQDLYSYPLNTFERSFIDDKIEVVYHRYNGLDGKVSRATVEENQEEERHGGSLRGYMSLYEGNGATTGKLCDIEWHTSGVWYVGMHGEPCSGGVVRSAILERAQAGTTITFYRSVRGKAGEDDYAVVKVHKEVFDRDVKIDSFESDFNNEYASLTYHHREGLDGHVSRIEVEV